MKLRTRLFVTLVLASLPITAGLVWVYAGAQRRAVVEGVYESTVQAMEDGGRELCESAERRGPPPAFGPRARRRRASVRRMFRNRHFYDERFTPTRRRSPAVPEELRARLEAGDSFATEWITQERMRMAMRMPFDGPCAVVLLERRVAPVLQGDGLRRIVLLALLINAVTALVALLALGPVVRRLRLLAADVRRAAATAYGEVSLDVGGQDEVAELARAFTDAAGEVRARVETIEARDEALREFLARTTHDVMVPLTVLQGHLSRLRQAEGARDEDALRGALEESHYLASLLRNLSAATRLDAGEPQITRHAFDLRDVVERAVARHRPIARAAEVALDHAVPEDAVPLVADSTLVEQAISNLVHNAVRYNRAGGHVAVVASARDGRFEVRVQDDGPGIPEAELARVTERSFRGGIARTASRRASASACTSCGTWPIAMAGSSVSRRPRRVACACYSRVPWGPNAPEVPESTSLRVDCSFKRNKKPVGPTHSCD